MERFFLDAIKFDVSVNASTYARLYFDIREAVEMSRRPWALRPLTKKDKSKLEVSFSFMNDASFMRLLIYLLAHLAKGCFYGTKVER